MFPMSRHFRADSSRSSSGWTDSGPALPEGTEPHIHLVRVGLRRLREVTAFDQPLTEALVIMGQGEGFESVRHEWWCRLRLLSRRRGKPDPDPMWRTIRVRRVCRARVSQNRLPGQRTMSGREFFLDAWGVGPEARCLQCLRRARSAPGRYRNCCARLARRPEIFASLAQRRETSRISCMSRARDRLSSNSVCMEFTSGSSSKKSRCSTPSSSRGFRPSHSANRGAPPTISADQRQQGRIGLKEREKLNASGQGSDEVIEPAKRGIRIGGLGQCGEQGRHDLGKDFAGHDCCGSHDGARDASPAPLPRCLLDRQTPCR